MAKVTVETGELEQLGKDIVKAQGVMLGRLAERGYQLLRSEVPVDKGNLKQGVSSPDVDYPKLRATLTVSARSARSGGGTAQVFGADGKAKKTVTLRPQPAYNYAEVIARGNKDATLTPKKARAFLIPVPAAPSGEGYLLIGGQVYVVRRSKKGMKPNPFDERAANKLSGEATRIGAAVLREFV